MSQQPVQHQIALAWLSEKETSSPGKYIYNIYGSDTTSISTLSSNKAMKVFDASLSPNNSNLHMLFDDDQHIPT